MAVSIMESDTRTIRPHVGEPRQIRFGQYAAVVTDEPGNPRQVLRVGTRDECVSALDWEWERGFTGGELSLMCNHGDIGLRFVSFVHGMTINPEIGHSRSLKNGQWASVLTDDGTIVKILRVGTHAECMNSLQRAWRNGLAGRFDAVLGLLAASVEDGVSARTFVLTNGEG